MTDIHDVMSITALLSACGLMPVTTLMESIRLIFWSYLKLTILQMENRRYRMIELPDTAQLVSDANTGLSPSNTYFLIILLNNSRKHCLQLKIIFSTSCIFKWQIFALVIRTQDFVEYASNV